MKRNLCLLAAGAAPLLVGFAFDWTITNLPMVSILYLVLGAALLCLWGYGAFALSRPEGDPVLQALCMCAVALLMLALVLFQELVVGRYWDNAAGLIPQIFFLPWIRFVSGILGRFLHYMWSVDLVIWLCLFAASCTGCVLKRRKARRA